MTSSAAPGRTTYTTPTDTTLVMTRVLAAPREVVFDAWTNPRHIRRWMTGPEGWTMPVCEVDLRPGGAWHHVWRMDDGTELSMRGTYLEVTPPTRVVSTESWGPDFPESRNAVEFEERDGLTIVTMTITYVSREARDAALATGMKEGMDLGFMRLDRLLEELG